MAKKVIVGLSGGVDSGVAAIELLKAGYDVEGMFMRNWDAATNHDLMGNPTLLDPLCPQEIDYRDAQDVAKKLGIKLHRHDFVEDYWERVFQHFLAEYALGRTPNPDILCNKEIKFKAFLEQDKQLGADFIAMGHYARVVHGKKNFLLRGIDRNKDQSYFLSQLTSEQLGQTLFPIGHLVKSDVRARAKASDLAIALKKDSTGVCFIGERNFKPFLQNYLPAKPGLMQTLEGRTLGEHDGVIYYTIGQRHGLGIGGPGGPWFVIGKDVQRNILFVGQGAQNEYLFGDRARITGLNIINERFYDGQELTAKFRYRQSDVALTVAWVDEKTLEVRTKKPVKAITPGQACVFYDGEFCLGGGTITDVFFQNQKRKY